MAAYSARRQAPAGEGAQGPALTVVALGAGAAPVAAPTLGAVGVALDHGRDEPRVADCETQKTSSEQGWHHPTPASASQGTERSRAAGYMGNGSRSA